jgi:hypothetical protein
MSDKPNDDEPHRTFLEFYIGVLNATANKLADTDGDTEEAGKVIAEHVDAIEDRAAKHVLKTKLASDALHAYDLARRAAKRAPRTWTTPADGTRQHE